MTEYTGKYRIGDQVRVLGNGLRLKEGDITVITGLYPFLGIIIGYNVERGNGYWHEGLLELVHSPHPHCFCKEDKEFEISCLECMATKFYP